MDSPADLVTEIRDDYLKYYNTPFAVANPGISAERQDLLAREGLVYREPLIEPLLDFVSSTQSIDADCADAGAHVDLAEFARLGTLPFGVDRLYEHQRRALVEAIQGRNIVVTAGTGSGKTEAFLLPVIDGLLRESAGWPASLASHDPWWESEAAFSEQRDGETRSAAMRALILYPMNALVEDQLTRLRRALDGSPIREWMDSHRGGNRFYFGRYTGQTPVSGARTNGRALDNLRDYLRGAARIADVAAEQDALAEREHKRFFVPRLDGAEMRSRWDMQSRPPDILITNYSMLNVMLLRHREDSMFAQTREWLESDPANVFTLVVDELHMYRGTAGSEVAYLLRNLFVRLGLNERPQQLRLLAASASLEEESSYTYLEQFFGTDRRTFAVIPGVVQPPSTAGTLDDYADDLAAITSETQLHVADALIDRSRAGDALAHVALTEDGRTRAVDLTTLRSSLFPHSEQSLATRALDGLLRAGAVTTAPFPRLRAHLFYRSIQGFWACSRPTCDQVPEIFQDTDRTVGKLFSVPRHRCDCGARVLELLYCQACGDAYLGGFSLADPSPDGLPQELLFPDLPELDELPDKGSTVRTSRNYLVYWPRTTELTSAARWTRASGQLSFAYQKALLDYEVGSIKSTEMNPTGWVFRIGHTGASGNETVPPFPTQCARCGSDWELSHAPIDDPRRFRSPIRAMRTGFEKVSQVLTDSLLRRLGDNRKLVVFSDSRQDAAKLAGGIELRHYQDLVRQLLVSAMTENAWRDLPAFEAVERGLATEPAAVAARARFVELHPGEARLLSDAIRGFSGPDGLNAAAAIRRRAELGATQIETAVRTVFQGLADLGTNPGGTELGNQHWGTENRPWGDLLGWSDRPIRLRPDLEGNPEAIDAMDNLRASLRDEALDAVFAGAGRDLESLGLAWISLDPARQFAPPPGVGDGEFAGIVASSLRILGEGRRLAPRHNGSANPPRRLGYYWSAVASARGIDPSALATAVIAAWGTSVVDFVILPSALYLRTPNERNYTCDRCGRRHLVDAVACTSCLGRLIVQEGRGSAIDDYYAYLATQAGAPFRLHCEELTGQTDRIESQQRQARFQDIFLRDENPLIDGVDLLSVTTTMEAGVDIGGLRGVVMSNMPPMRFNYQQRVGRAGRRRDQLSVALTICRGRSHDDYYFARPDRITGDPPPPPYLDLTRKEIARRVLLSEVLRRALWEVQPTDGLDLGDNIHGQFGSAADWLIVRRTVDEYRRDHLADIVDLAHALTSFSPWQDTLATELVEELPQMLDQIDVVAGEDHRPEDLSARLAEAGYLPMFGFPTSVRYLYHREPRRSYPWPPNGVVDRDLPLAVIQYAPGGEVVKDKAVHTAVGIADWFPSLGRPRPVSDALGPDEDVAVCRTCLHLGYEPTDHCPICGEVAPRFRRLKLAQPAGFATNFRPRSFDGSFEWSGATASLKVLPMPSPTVELRWGRASIRGGRSLVYAINDNRGEDYRFARSSAYPGWLSADLVDDARLRARLNLPPYDASSVRRVALGAKWVTDTLLVSMTAIPGLTFDPRTTAARATWFSYGFLLREAATRLLDIQSQELRVGVHGRLVDGQPAGELFLADSLANGAGYSSYLAREDVFGRLVAEVDGFIDDVLQAEIHSGQCTTSCYDCLRSFENMSYHPLLDWRLARDLHNLLKGVPIDQAQWAELEASTNDDLIRNFDAERMSLGGSMVGVAIRGRALLLTHPLEATDEQMSERLALATATAERDVGSGNIRYATLFDAMRRPSWVVAQCLSS